MSTNLYLEDLVGGKILEADTYNADSVMELKIKLQDGRIVTLRIVGYIGEDRLPYLDYDIVEEVEEE